MPGKSIHLSIPLPPPPPLSETSAEERNRWRERETEMVCTLFIKLRETDSSRGQLAKYKTEARGSIYGLVGGEARSSS